MIWKTEFDIDILNKTQAKTLVKHLDIVFTEKGDDYLKATMPVDHRTHQPYGLLHGGASCVLAETMGSVASVFCTEDPLKNKCVGVEINANHLRSVSSGLVTGIVKPIKIGRRMHVWQIDIFDEENRQVCSSRLTTMVIS